MESQIDVVIPAVFVSELNNVILRDGVEHVKRNLGTGRRMGLHVSPEIEEHPLSLFVKISLTTSSSERGGRMGGTLPASSGKSLRRLSGHDSEKDVTEIKRGGGHVEDRGGEDQ
jgi:hypothetical protein